MAPFVLPKMKVRGMKERIDAQIKRFTSLLEGGKLPYEVTEVCQYAYQVSPRIPNPRTFPDKPIPLTIMAVTHGNEVGGISVLNQLIELLISGIVTLDFPIQLALGNPWASREEKRFLERDLNRSFGRSSSESHEDRRASELEPMLLNTSYLLDIHQTIEASHRPFFIFPYKKECYDFARAIADDVSIVTHWGGGFSKDGACTDEFVNKNGGTGITIELGQKGFHPYQEGVGLRASLESIKLVANRLKEIPDPVASNPPEIFTWAEVIPFPDGSASLDEGWYNFQWVEEGQRLGFKEDEEILAPCAGPILFPKYIRESSGPQKPKEICRIMKSVTEGELGR